jgi:hypothetical protein
LAENHTALLASQFTAKCPGVYADVPCSTLIISGVPYGLRRAVFVVGVVHHRLKNTQAFKSFPQELPQALPIESTE